MYRQIVAEYHSDNRNKLFASNVFICFHCFLSSKNSLNFSLSRKYPKVIIQLRRVGYQTCKFFTSIKIIKRKRLLKTFYRNKTILVICLVVLLVLDINHAAPMPRRNRTKYKCHHGKCVLRKHGGGGHHSGEIHFLRNLDDPFDTTDEFDFRQKL